MEGGAHPGGGGEEPGTEERPRPAALCLRLCSRAPMERRAAALWVSVLVDSPAACSVGPLAMRRTWRPLGHGPAGSSRGNWGGAVREEELGGP